MPSIELLNEANEMVDGSRWAATMNNERNYAEWWTSPYFRH